MDAHLFSRCLPSLLVLVIEQIGRVNFESKVHLLRLLQHRPLQLHKAGFQFSFGEVAQVRRGRRLLEETGGLTVGDLSLIHI